MIVLFVSTMSKQARAPSTLLAVQAATKQRSATVNVNAETYHFTAPLFCVYLFVRETMWWWLPLVRKKFCWWTDLKQVLGEHAKLFDGSLGAYPYKKVHI